jgi:hypothetical protein
VHFCLKKFTNFKQYYFHTLAKYFYDNTTRRQFENRALHINVKLKLSLCLNIYSTMNSFIA